MWLDAVFGRAPQWAVFLLSGTTAIRMSRVRVGRPLHTKFEEYSPLTEPR
jgi:hypothetical protein